MNRPFEGPYPLQVFTLGHKPLLTEELRPVVEQGIRNLPKRYPGLKVLRHAVHPDHVEMVLDLKRLDEDLSRIVQSFKAEVKGLARKNGFNGNSLWQWAYEEQEEKEGA